MACCKRCCNLAERFLDGVTGIILFRAACFTLPRTPRPLEGFSSEWEDSLLLLSSLRLEGEYSSSSSVSKSSSLDSSCCIFLQTIKKGSQKLFIKDIFITYCHQFESLTFFEFISLLMWCFHNAQCATTRRRSAR